jgi:long-chain acyl-CoA synthetase
MNTGDIGLMTFNGCLKILGRSKETIVLRSGENIEPVPIEGRLVESSYIDQCMVIGQDQKGLAALLVPNLEALRSAGFSAESTQALRAVPGVKDLIDAEVRRLICAETGFKAFERITDWRFLPAPFQLGDELTNTFKLKRHIIAEKYDAIIREIYPE